MPIYVWRQNENSENEDIVVEDNLFIPYTEELKRKMILNKMFKLSKSGKNISKKSKGFSILYYKKKYLIEFHSLNIDRLRRKLPVMVLIDRFEYKDSQNDLECQIHDSLKTASIITENDRIKEFLTIIQNYWFTRKKIKWIVILLLLIMLFFLGKFIMESINETNRENYKPSIEERTSYSSNEPTTGGFRT